MPLLARISFDDPQTVGNPREIGGPSDYEEIWRAAFARGR